MAETRARTEAAGVRAALTYVLDADTDLGRGSLIFAHVLIAARQLATARVLHAPGRRLRLAPLSTRRSGARLILDGVRRPSEAEGDRTALELVFWLPAHCRVEAADLLGAADAGECSATRFAVSDAAFADRVRPLGRIVQGCSVAPVRRTSVSTAAAITCQPRLESASSCSSGTWPPWGASKPAGIRLTPAAYPPAARQLVADRATVGLARNRAPRHAGLVTATQAISTCTARWTNISKLCSSGRLAEGERSSA